MARQHTIPSTSPKNRKTACWDCGKMVTPAKAKEWCPGKPVAPTKKRK